MILNLILVLLISTAYAQEGHQGQGHDAWHGKFYQGLISPKGYACCNLNDCRPTVSRMIGAYYEVKINGQWVKVTDPKVIMKMMAPDGGAHVCASPKMPNTPICVILPPEG